MSESSYSRARVLVRASISERAAASLGSRLRKLLSEAGQLPSSMEIDQAFRRAYAPLPALDTPDALAARVARLQELPESLEPEVMTALNAAGPLSVPEILEPLSRLEGPELIGAVQSAEIQLLAAKDAAVASLGRAERHSVVEAATTALANLGWSDMAQHTSDDAVGLTAVRGSAVMGLQILDGGLFVHDVIGLGGTGCIVATDEVFNELGRLGFPVTSAARHYHGDDPRASLLGQAAALAADRGCGLEEALADVVDGPACSVRPAVRQRGRLRT